MVYLLKKLDDGNYEVQQDAGRLPVDGIAAGKHWLKFDPMRFNGEDAYRRKAIALYTELSPPFTDGVTPFILDINSLDMEGAHMCTSGFYPDVHDKTATNRADIRRHLIVTQSSQTGDIIHVAAALLHDPMTDVVVVYPDGNPGIAGIKATYELAIGAADALNNSYQQLRDPAERIRAVKDVDPPSLDGMQLRSWYDCLRRDTSDTPFGQARGHILRFGVLQYKDKLAYVRSDDAILEYPVGPVGCATTIVGGFAEQYLKSKGTVSGKKAFLDKNIKGLSITENGFRQKAVDYIKSQYSLDLGPGAGRQRYLLVWSRFSGGYPNGYNPAGDSSVPGQKQLIKLGDDPKRIVITIGHGPYNQDFPADMKGKIHLGEFWTNPTGDNPFTAAGRPGQVTFYDLLNTKHDVIQVGQKTGGMDAAALVGMRTVYIEAKDSHAIQRMEKWTKTMPWYKSAIVDKAPTALGRLILAEYAKLVKQKVGEPGNFAEANRLGKATYDATAPPDIGYSPAGVKAIGDTLRTF
ncbi:hypothetical protein PUNSTDRAFT_134279 [Punctularia strigosozonata HHB-11173 SS5]|uniref:uncharacterized protein n=1 Tax=Punctularia strigosozonata (strain HHB-11173) TaxID=741275 RepID=UPI0004416C25|nr:uncharacterized protein PUNSTDRAFT_134279 [Punctularia strigosozonata HHB-11173 SS5]EIN09112.1 hypothetical protein PUNSTDRAFT_134279 [Punctularia strigosozonata HHB-11173 SS5]